MERGILPCVVIAVLFIGCLAAVDGGRSSYRDDGRRENNTIANATTTAAVDVVDESKLYLKFCAARDCDTKGEPYMNNLCICCLVLPDVPCWDTYQMCQDNCPGCGPNCPSGSPPSTGELRA